MSDNSGSGLITSMSDGFSLNIGGNICHSISDIATGMVNIGKIDTHHINIAENYSGFGTQIGDFFNL